MRDILDESCARHLELGAARIEALEIQLKDWQDSSEAYRIDCEREKARVEELTSQLETSRLSAHNAEQAVDVLESNARVQAKLLADTGRRAEELEAALRPFAHTGWMTGEIEHTPRTVVAHMHPEREREIILSSEDFKRARDLLAALPQSSTPAR